MPAIAVNSARGAARFAAEAIGTAGAAGCSGLIVVRADSSYYSAAFSPLPPGTTELLVFRRD